MNENNNSILPFSLEGSNLRGRIVRLGSVLDEILSAHGYPIPIEKLTAESAVLSLLLASMLKFDGIFTLQVQGDGPVRMVVADVTTAGDLRACATYREGQVGALSDNPGIAVFGKGYMAFTVDQGDKTDRYQGIVELKGESLVESTRHYFQQSEQISTGIKLVVGKVNGKWHGAAIMLQRLPETGHDYHARESVLKEDEDWHRVMILLDSCTDRELLDLSLPSPDLLFRLFHEEGVRVYDAGHIRKGCRCNMERLSSILSTMSAEDRQDMIENGKITMLCQFCNKDFAFDPAEIERKITGNL